MFSYIASAIVLFMCCGQAVPRMREVHLVLVISAAPSAILLPMSHSSWMCG